MPLRTAPPPPAAAAGSPWCLVPPPRSQNVLLHGIKRGSQDLWLCSLFAPLFHPPQVSALLRCSSPRHPCTAEGYSSMALRNPFSIAAAQGASKRAAGSSAEEGPAEAKRSKNPGSSSGSDLTVLHPNTKAVLSCGAMRERLYHLLKLSSSSYLCPVTPHPCRVLGLEPYTVQYP